MPSSRASTVGAYATIAALVALAALIFLASTYGAMRFGAEIFRAHISSKQWITTSGQIISSAAVEGCGKGRGYYLDVTYKYTVNSSVYTSSKVWFGNGYCAGRVGAESMAARFPAGATTYVHYNPTAPSESVLYRSGVENGTYFLFFLTLCVPLGVIGLVAKVIFDSRAGGAYSVTQPLEDRLLRRERLDKSIQIEVQERLSEKSKVKENATDA